MDQELKDKLDALIAASTEVQTQNAAILAALDEIKNPSTPKDAFTQEEADAVFAALDAYKNSVEALVTPEATA